MKKIYFIAWLFASMMCVGLSSCGDDPDITETPGLKQTRVQMKIKVRVRKRIPERIRQINCMPMSTSF